MSILELLLLVGMAFGGANVVQTQPLLWLGTTAVRAAGPAAVMVLVLREPAPPPPAAPGTIPPGTLGGPVGIMPPPGTVQPGFAPPPPPPPPRPR